MVVMLNKNGTYRPVNLGMGRTGFECYHPDCNRVATTHRLQHHGAAERACSRHGGRCHVECWTHIHSAAPRLN
jgi:hypothetical protein